MITVGQLQNQTGVPGPHPSLHCDQCGNDYSANKSDYFMAPSDHPFTCCGEPMRLVRRRVILEEVAS